MRNIKRIIGKVWVRSIMIVKDFFLILDLTAVFRLGVAGVSFLMFVVGATHPEKFKEIRAIAPDNFLLVPGIGAQGGDLQEVLKYGSNDMGGLLINSSRGIIYAGDGEDFADKAREAALALQQEMEVILSEAF